MKIATYGIFKLNQAFFPVWTAQNDVYFADVYDNSINIHFENFLLFVHLIILSSQLYQMENQLEYQLEILSIISIILIQFLNQPLKLLVSQELLIGVQTNWWLTQKVKISSQQKKILILNKKFIYETNSHTSLFFNQDAENFIHTFGKKKNKKTSGRVFRMNGLKEQY